jgi:hypothetical protein
VVADIAKLSLGREAYYTRELATDHEQYLSGHGESPGRWYGAGASSLGLEGEACSPCPSYPRRGQLSRMSDPPRTSPFGRALHQHIPWDVRDQEEVTLARLCGLTVHRPAPLG